VKSLRQARKEKGYILKAISGLTGLTVQHLSWIETGKVPPSYFIRQLLERAVESKISWLSVKNIPVQI
jgi:transcriptional regulator with XRE-family HTH domain